MSFGEEDLIFNGATIRIFDATSCSDYLEAYQGGNLFTGYTFHQNGSLYIYNLGYNIPMPPGSPPTFVPERHKIRKLCNGYDYSDLLPIEDPGDFNEDSTIQAIATGLDSIIYAAGARVWSFDPVTGEVNFIGGLPPEWKVEGGMTLREGELYMTAIGNKLIRLNTENPANSELIYTFPDSIPRIESLVTIPYTCDSIITYAFAPTGSFGEPSILYELSFEDFSLTPICTSPEAIIAAASLEEVMIPPCELRADLDLMDETAAGLDYLAPASCTTPINITSPNPEVYGQIEIDSLVLTLSGVMDVGAEYLTGTGNLAVGIQFNDPTQITLYNLGSATEEDFEMVLAGVQYINDATQPSYGPRTVSVEVHALYYQGLPAIATINLVNETLNLSAEVKRACFDQNTGEIALSASGGAEPYQFDWENGSDGSSLTNLAPGDYVVTLTDAASCYRIDTVAVGENDSLYVTVTAPLDSICGATGSLSAFPGGGTPPYSYTWNLVADNSPSIHNLPPDTYSLQLTDGLGCMAENDYTLFAADTVFTSEQLTECEGTPITYQGQLYDTDTTFCITNTSIAGCDSIHCVSLIFQDTFYQSENYLLCAGESLNWQGLTFTQDTSVCMVYTNSAGCDSTYCLELNFISRISNMQAQICEGESYDFNGQMLFTAGIYQDTIIDGGLCDSIVMLELGFYPEPSVSIQADGSLCQGETVTLSGQGSGQYEWSTGASSSSILVENAGTYYLMLTDANGCTAVDSIVLSDEAPTLSLQMTGPNCPDFPNGSIRIDTASGGTPPYLYSLNGNPLQSQGLFTNLEAGAYSIMVEDANGCRRTFDATLSNQSDWSVDLGADETIQLGEKIPIHAALSNSDAIATIFWQPSDFLECDTCLSTVAQPFQTITYQAFFTDSLGCTVSDEITITVEQREGLYIPNAFSPNDDGRNDQLIIFGNETITNIKSLRIYNRWGGLAYERQHFLPNTADAFNWDGTISGEPAPVGVYIYQVTYTDIAGNEKGISGEVNLLR
jgi:gliding motility-associated-like protein